MPTFLLLPDPSTLESHRPEDHQHDACGDQTRDYLRQLIPVCRMNNPGCAECEHERDYGL
jgi:hypothetical protein